MIKHTKWTVLFATLLITACATHQVKKPDRAREDSLNRQYLQRSGAQIIAMGDELRIILPADYFFKEQGPALNPAHYRELEGIANLLQRYGNTPIHIAGYTDSIGDARQQQLKSQARAQSVLSYLWSHGVSAHHLYAKGYGEANPIAANDTNLGKAANRRVEITLRAGCPNPMQD